MNRFFDQIGATVAERIAGMELSVAEERIRDLIQRYFAANGTAPRFVEIKKRLNLASVEFVKETVKKLEDADILTVRQNEITSSYPFSAVATRHKVIFGDGREVFATCATDAFGIHFLVEKDLTILSRCPHCEGAVSIQLKEGRIDTYKPDEVIEFVSNTNACGSNAESLCPSINLFCSRKHLSAWLAKNDLQDGQTFSLQEVLEHSKKICGPLRKPSEI